MTQVHTPWGTEMDQRIAADVLQQEYDPLELPAFSTSWDGAAIVLAQLRQYDPVLIQANARDYVVETTGSNHRDLIQITAETGPLAVCQLALAQRDLLLTNGNYLLVRQALIRRDGLECAYCGGTVRFAVEVQSAISALDRAALGPAEYQTRCTELNRSKIVIGHKLWPSLGGTDFIENLIIAHAYCNASLTRAGGIV